MSEARVVHRSTIHINKDYGLRVDHVSTGEITLAIVENLPDRKIRIGAKIILSPSANLELIRVLKKTPEIS